MWLEIILFCILVTALAMWGFPSLYSAIVFILFLAIILPLNSPSVSNGIQRGITDIVHDRWAAALIVICITLSVIWNASPDSIFFSTLFLCFLLYKWDSRIVAAGALISLAICPMLLLLNQNVWAELMAVYAYFFLVITVALQIVEYKRHPQEHE
jgi:hypothetical protein